MVDKTKVTTADLRAIGRQGGATAKLLSGEIITLEAKYGVSQRPVILNGQTVVIAGVIMQYAEIIKQIRTVQRNGVLIARQEGQGTRRILRLTGKGYRR